MCVKCIPFLSEATCTDKCAEWMDETELDHERHIEEAEELLATSEVVYHFFIASYMCFALALLCEDFFVAALDIIIIKMDLPPDVAGATLMAAGTSSPELFTASVGVFITHDPVGVGAVVGSTMFNTLCIVGGSAIVCGQMVQLDSRIFYRDGLSYAFSICLLYVCLVDGEMTAVESWVLLIGYICYVVCESRSVHATTCPRVLISRRSLLIGRGRCADTVRAIYEKITSRFCPKFTHSMDDIDIEEMARTSSSWTSPLADVRFP